MMLSRGVLQAPLSEQQGDIRTKKSPPGDVTWIFISIAINTGSLFVGGNHRKSKISLKLTKFLKLN